MVQLEIALIAIGIGLRGGAICMLVGVWPRARASATALAVLLGALLFQEGAAAFRHSCDSVSASVLGTALRGPGLGVVAVVLVWALQRRIAAYERCAAALRERVESAQHAAGAMESRVAEQAGAMAETERHRRQAEQAAQSSHARLEAAISERAAMQARLEQAEQDAAAAAVTAGVAQELNNPLSGILRAAEAATREPEDRTFVQCCLREIHADAERCGRIVASMLRFARREATRKSPSDVNRLLHRAIGLLRDEVEPRRGALRLDLAPDLPLVPLNPTEVEHAFGSLIKEALAVCVAPAAVRIRSERGARGVRISISDHGQRTNGTSAGPVGESAQSSDAAAPGAQAGLVLAHAIIVAQGGRIERKCDPDAGTTVAVELPLGED